jgi:serine protease Do
VGNTKPGTKSTLTVFRRGASRDLSVTIAEVEPDKPGKRASDRDEPAPKPPASAAAKSLGLAVSDLTDAQKKELKLKGGVKVDAANDAAARAGLREGDIILSVGNVEVSNAREFESAIGKADKSKALSVLFRRGDWAQYALIRPAR